MIEHINLHKTLFYHFLVHETNVWDLSAQVTTPWSALRLLAQLQLQKQANKNLKCFTFQNLVSRYARNKNLKYFTFQNLVSRYARNKNPFFRRAVPTALFFITQ